MNRTVCNDIVFAVCDNIVFVFIPASVVFHITFYWLSNRGFKIFQVSATER